MEVIYYCPVWQVCWTPHGKEYTIKTHRGWKYINYNNTKLGLAKIPTKLRIRDFEDFIFCYIFCNWHRNYPCVAMELFINKKLKQKYYGKRI